MFGHGFLHLLRRKHFHSIEASPVAPFALPGFLYAFAFISGSLREVQLLGPRRCTLLVEASCKKTMKTFANLRILADSHPGHPVRPERFEVHVEDGRSSRATRYWCRG